MEQQTFEFIQPDLNKQVDLIEKDQSKRIILKSVFNRLWPTWELFTAQEELLSLLILAIEYFDDIDDLVFHLENISGTLNEESKIRHLEKAGLAGITHYDRLKEDDLKIVMEVFGGQRKSIDFLAALSQDQLKPANESFFVKTLNALAAQPV